MNKPQRDVHFGKVYALAFDVATEFFQKIRPPQVRAIAVTIEFDVA